MTWACVVTGGGGPAVGSGISLAVARAGMKVWVADRDAAAAAAVVEEIRGEGGEADSVQIDTADPGSIADGMKHVLEVEALPVRGLVNSAGIGFNALAAEMEVEDFDRIIAIDLRGPWLCAKALLPAMQAAGGGSIVNIGSVHALATEPSQTAYAAAKAGLVGMTRAIAVDYGRVGVRCNIIHPGAVPSREVFDEGGLSRLPPVYGVTVRQHQMLEQLIHPVDIGNAAVFLLGDGARSITGQSLVVDAGMRARLRPPWEAQ